MAIRNLNFTVVNVTGVGASSIIYAPVVYMKACIIIKL